MGADSSMDWQVSSSGLGPRGIGRRTKSVERELEPCECIVGQTRAERCIRRVSTRQFIERRGLT